MATTSINMTGGTLPGVPIGPRLRAELERRCRELQGRFKPTPGDMRELARLRELLKVTPSETAESDDARPPLTMSKTGVIEHG